MKYNKILRTLALAIILGLLVVAVPASPALAAEYISVSPDDGEVDDRIDIDGTGFTPGDDVDIYFTSEEVEDGDDIDDLDVYEELKTRVNIDSATDPVPGEFYTSFRVPDVMDDGDTEEEVTGGTYYVFVTYGNEDNIEAVDEFTVMGITIDPVKGTVGTKVKITGAGFGKNDPIDIKYDGDDIDIEDGDDDTDSKGKFTSYILVPESAQGDHDISIEVDGDESAAEFTVQPQVAIDPTEGPPGTEVTVTGTGFAKSKDITITFGDNEVDISGDDKTDSKGSFEANFDVPAVTPGKYDVEIEDADGNKAEADFTMAVSMDLSPTAGNVDTPLTVSGTGFIPGKTVTIKYDAADIATTTVANDGGFTATFNAPASQGGSHTITVTDGTTTLTSTFTMESTPPPIPAPLLPELDTKEKAEAHFDWKDVEDPSGVTYTLQVATDKDFTGDSVVLVKPRLTESEYTITEEAEKLESTKKEAPYYWRVMAIDGAGNKSEWSGTGAFHVGFTFEMTGWIIYVLMGFGGILLLLIGIFLGRRTAYY